MTLPRLILRTTSVVLAVLLSVPAPLWADPAKAAEYYQQATEAYEAGDLERAADLLNSAYAEDPDLVYQYNRILALQGLERYEEALQVVAALEAPMKADPQNRFEDIGEIRAQLEGQLERQRAENEPVAEEPVEPSGGEEVVVTDELTPEADGPNIVALGLIGGGAALVIPGLIFVTGNALPGLAANCLGIPPRTQDDAACADFNAQRRGGESSASAGQLAAQNLANTHAIVSVVLLALGGAAIIGGTVLLVLGGSDERAEAESDAAFSLGVAPYFGHDGGGAMLQLQF